MASKIKSVYICSECGYESPKWYGKCPSCGEWNTMNEEIKETSKNATVTKSRTVSSYSRPATISEISIDDEHRYDTGCKELNRVLGGGIVKGSLILLGGDPGIGKSTVLMQICQFLGDTLKILYISGEESKRQLKLRAIRLGVDSPNLFVMTETDVEIVCEQIKSVKPDLVMVDSIQTMNLTELSSSPGSVTQVRECTNMLMRTAKGCDIPMFIVGYVNKEGSIAGPKVLEHIVDTVLQFEGDRQYLYRILRAIKNRFGSTSEIGIYEMVQKGLREVKNPSEMLLSQNRTESMSGISIGVSVEGVRPFLIEVQSLVSTAAYGTPQRSVTGFDPRRMNMLLAVLEKRVGFKLAQKDVFLNIAGGLKVSDPALDLSVVSAILSSNFDIIVPDGVAMVGEVGLSGEIRTVTRVEQRVAEAQKLGFTTIYIPKGNLKGVKDTFTIEIKEVGKVEQLFRELFS